MPEPDTTPAMAALREQIRRVLAEADNYTFESLEPHDYRDQADAVLAALQGLYVPPPPGSDRDALPGDLRLMIAPHMRPYISTACETALALDQAAQIHLPSMATLLDWERRQHAACRITRKQDMATCQCDCHTTAQPSPERIAATTDQPPDRP